MIFIAVAINLVFLVYGLLKDELVIRDHFPSIYIVIASRVMSVILALLGFLFVQGAGWKGKALTRTMCRGLSVFSGAPLTTFAFFPFANDTSTWAGYEMLKYVSFAVQVMAKSASVLLPMITAYLVNKQVYNFWECVQAILLVTTVAVMQSGHPGEVGVVGHDQRLGASVDPLYRQTRCSPSCAPSSGSGTPSLQEKRCVSSLSLVCSCTRRLLQRRRKARI